MNHRTTFMPLVVLKWFSQKLWSDLGTHWCSITCFQDFSTSFHQFIYGHLSLLQVFIDVHSLIRYINVCEYCLPSSRKVLVTLRNPLDYSSFPNWDFAHKRKWWTIETQPSCVTSSCLGIVSLPRHEAEERVCWRRMCCTSGHSLGCSNKCMLKIWNNCLLDYIDK